MGEIEQTRESAGRGGGEGSLTHRLTPHMYTSRTRLPNPLKISKAGSCHTSFPCESSIRQSHTAQICCERQERTKKSKTTCQKIGLKIFHLRGNELFVFSPSIGILFMRSYFGYLSKKCTS